MKAMYAQVKKKFDKMTAGQRQGWKAQLWAEAEATGLVAYQAICRCDLNAAIQVNALHRIMLQLDSIALLEQKLLTQK